MVQVSILGTGNVAKHLFDTLVSVENVDVVQVIGRNRSALKDFGNGTRTTSDFKGIADADIFIIAVKDDAITTVSQYLRDKKGLIVHTSGSVSMDVLSENGRYGVFYPLQTFSKHREVDMKSVPICLEAHDRADMDLLKKLAVCFSENVYEVDSEQRKSLHLAAVFVNNFTNHLYYIGQQICEEEGLPFGMLHPLIRETVDKIGPSAPYEVQTGPARRGDLETIKKHLEQLKNRDYKEVYEVLSKSIGKL
jgi:predicted short-subunit dehydrogenase-like oxidoreductase (DUF2520 family)